MAFASIKLWLSMGLSKESSEEGASMVEAVSGGRSRDPQARSLQERKHNKMPSGGGRINRSVAAAGLVREGECRFLEFDGEYDEHWDMYWR
jgi:hypothetical protein